MTLLTDQLLRTAVVAAVVWFVLPRVWKVSPYTLILNYINKTR